MGSERLTLDKVTHEEGDSTSEIPGQLRLAPKPGPMQDDAPKMLALLISSEVTRAPHGEPAATLLDLSVSHLPVPRRTGLTGCPPPWGHQ